MKVLIISQFYRPETGGPPNRIASFVDYLSANGIQTDVITAKPNHPQGIIWDDYKGGLFKKEEKENSQTVYSWIYTRPEKNFIKRILFYVSFMTMAVFASFKLKGKYDVVIASSPPLFVGISGWMVSRLKKARYIFDVRDLWPEVAVAMGELNNKKAQKIAYKMEKFIYRKAHHITAVTDSFKDKIHETVSSTPVSVVMNGTVPDVFVNGTPSSQLRSKLNLDKDKFIVGYCGNMGLAQGLEHFIHAASKIEQNSKGIEFLLVGDGPKLDHLKETAEQLQVSNVTFHPRVGQQEAAEYMNACDALLVPLAKDDIYKMFIPSKLFDSMAAGKPVLLSVDGEARTILEKSKAGLYYEAENAKQLAESVEYLQANPHESRQMGENGYKAAREYYSRDRQSERMEELLRELIGDLETE